MVNWWLIGGQVVDFNRVTKNKDENTRSWVLGMYTINIRTTSSRHVECLVCSYHVK